MERKAKIFVLIISILIIFISSLTISFYLFPGKNNVNVAFSKNTSYQTLVLGQNDKGSVTMEGPYGNVNSPVKIAYIVGVHPREKNAHQAIQETIDEQNKSLNYCYYIYKVDVTLNPEDYEVGRMNGQKLANEYVVPSIINQKFNLVIDVHENAGNWDENRFIFSPVNGSKAENIAHEITSKLKWLTYYVPPNPTSTRYVTQPLNEAQIPAVVYETYDQDTYQLIKTHAEEFAQTVDKLQL